MTNNQLSLLDSIPSEEEQIEIAKQELIKLQTQSKAIAAEYARQRRQINNEIKRQSSIINGTKTTYPSVIFLTLIFSKMIVENKDLDTTIDESIQEYDKDKEWFDKMKYEKLRGLANSVITKYSKTAKYKRLVKYGGIQTTELRKQEDTQAILRMLSKASHTLAIIESLQQRIKELESENTLLKNNHVADDKKALAKEYKSQGLSNKIIAEEFGVSVKTIGRWVR